MAVATLQNPNPSIATVGRQPQTTAQQGAQAAPFTRLARKAEIQGFSQSGIVFTAPPPVTQNLKPVGGYLRYLVMLVQASSGGGTNACVASADAPFNSIQSFIFKDPSGQPFIQMDGYGLYLMNLYSGQVAELGFQNPSGLPSWAAIQTTSGAGCGNFTFRLLVPLEFDSAAYCCLPGLNASAQPQVVINFNTSATVYTTPPLTVPTLAVTVNQRFWTVPIANTGATPPGLGSSFQWTQTQGQQSVPTGAFVRVTIPAVGQWWGTSIFVLRDNTNARVANFPTTDLAFNLDNFPLEFEALTERQDLIYMMFGVAAPTGVLVYSFRDSVRRSVAQDDTHDLLLPTTPASLVELSGTFQTITNSPGTITAYVGQLYPSGGIPYTHLAA